MVTCVAGGAPGVACGVAGCTGCSVGAGGAMGCWGAGAAGGASCAGAGRAHWSATAHSAEMLKRCNAEISAFALFSFSAFAWWLALVLVSIFIFGLWSL